MTETQQLLTKEFPYFRLEFNYPLADHTYFKLGGPAEVYVELEKIEQIQRLVAFCHSKQIPLTILGGASNVVISDTGVQGVVLHLTNDEVSLHPTKEGIIVASAGIKTALLVRKTVDLGYTGLEYFLGVPGTLGGAIYNNAHYLEDLMGEHVHRVEIITPAGDRKWLTHDECQFSYDHSRFQQTSEVIVTVEFSLKKGDLAHSQELIREATVYRAKTQPLGLPSSGCIFQNPVNTDELKARFPQFADRAHIPGGFLIDQAGLKGKKVGDIEVSQKHAAFMINRGSGTAHDLQKLIELVKHEVDLKFGVELQEEVFYLE